MSQHPKERELTNDERTKYDRAGFIGHIVQKRLLASNILIVNMSGCNTELAKNLILAGANITIVDAEVIKEVDIDTNFLFTKDVIGKKRGEEAQKEFLLINPLVKIEWIEQFPEENIISNYNAFVTSTKDFDEMTKYDALSQKYNIPYYNQVCCGYYGYMYIGLGTQFIYEREKKVIVQLSFGKKLSQQDQYREFEEVIATSNKLEDTLNFSFKSSGMVQNIIYYCILMMKNAQKIPELKAYDPYQPNEQLLEQFVTIGSQIYKEANGNEPTDQIKETFKNFAKFYGVDYCPVYSVIGSVASQELITSTSRINEPGINWFCYDSQQSYGQIEVIQDISQFPTKDLPDRKQLIIKE